MLSWAGVGQWLLHVLGWVADYRPMFHATTQVQGFLTAFAAGFLYTAVPRRTESAPPATWQLLVTGIGLVGVPVAGWFHLWWVSQLCWLAASAVLLGFLTARLLPRYAQRRPPNSFIWLPAGLLLGMAGSIVMLVAGVGPDAESWALPLGRGPLFQGMFLSLVVGVGGLVLPLMTRAKPAPDWTSSRADKMARLGHVVAVVVLIGSFVAEQMVSVRVGLGLRAAVVVAVLGIGAELWRLPDQPGLNPWLLWLAGWAVPAGFVVGCVMPEQYRAGLHVTFIGGFALLALAVGAQVTLGHQGYEADKRGHPWQLLAIGVLVAAAVILRLLLDLDPTRYALWMGMAASAFVLATVVWLAYLLPKIFHPNAPQSPP